MDSAPRLELIRSSIIYKQSIRWDDEPIDEPIKFNNVEKKAYYLTVTKNITIFVPSFQLC